MALTSVKILNGLPEIRTERLCLRIAHEWESEKIARFQRRNREHVQPWEPLREPGYYEDAYWADAPLEEADRARDGTDFRFRMVLPEGGEFLGNVTLRDIYNGASSSATLGYTVDTGAVGKGYATEAVAAVVDFAFTELNLHRLEACHMPANHRSARVLEKLGFEREGVLRGSLRVNGVWEDHVLVAKLNPGWKGDA